MSEVKHMCPACGHPARTECPTCSGTGLVTAEQLAAYTRWWNDQIAKGARIVHPATQGPRRTVPTPRGIS